VVRDCRLAGVDAPPADVVLDELGRAKNAGERHLHADHVVPISGREDPRRLDLDNMQTLCDTCHRRKTLKDNGLRTAARMAAPGPDR
jgi:5-methylcytosine-specific restriction endonuclease McrA